MTSVLSMSAEREGPVTATIWLGGSPDLAQEVTEGVNDRAGVDHEDAGRRQQAGGPTLVVVGPKEHRPGLRRGRHGPHDADGGPRGGLRPAVRPEQISADVEPGGQKRPVVAGCVGGHRGREILCGDPFRRCRPVPSKPR